MLDFSKIHNGEALTVLQTLESDSIDSMVTDPPYGYAFMNKDWDKVVVSVDIWKECLRVLKPGAFAFIMSSPRQDVLSRMIVNLQDAGFETGFTSLYHSYASGFPKAASISKLADKRNGRNYNPEFREYVNNKRLEKGLTFKDINEYLGYSIKGGNFASDLLGDKLNHRFLLPSLEIYKKLKTLLDLNNRFDDLIEREEAEREIIGKGKSHVSGEGEDNSWNSGYKLEYDYTKSATEQAKALDGSYAGFQPKPAVEIVLVVMKPLSEKSYVDQALANKKGVTWFDSVKIPASDDNVFDVLCQACDSIQDVASPTIWYNKNYKNLYHHIHDNDGILGKELRRFVPFRSASTLLHSNAVLYENSENAISNFLSDCPACRHLYDALIRLTIISDEDVFPLLTDVLGYIRRFAEEHKRNQQRRCNVRLSNVRELLRILGVLVSGDNLAFYNDPRYTELKRFPANLLVSDDVLNDGTIHKSGSINDMGKGLFNNEVFDHPRNTAQVRRRIATGDSGSYSRYFDLDKWFDTTFPFLICPKASKAERNMGLITSYMGAPVTDYRLKNRMENGVITGTSSLTRHKVNDGRKTPIDNPFQRGETLRVNTHPTVKPIKLMSYLIMLGSREGDTILDPFCGSGTTLIAAKMLKRNYLGIEINQEYSKIAASRLEFDSNPLQTKLIENVITFDISRKCNL